MVGGLASRVSGGDGGPQDVDGGPQDVDGGPHRGVEGGRVLQLDPQVQPSRPKRGHLSISVLAPRDLSNQLPVLDVDLMGMVEASVRWEEHRIPLIIMKAAEIMTDIDFNNLL